MNGADLKIIEQSKGVANGVQKSYADALRGAVPASEDRVPPSIGWQCPVYTPGMGPAPLGSATTSVSVGSGQTIRV